MPRKEKTNAKTWERDRRNRMNTYFKTLSDLLPPHQEGRKRNKVDILIQASKYIKELNNRADELFGAHAGEAHKEELSRLKKLVSQLFSHTQLLSALLRDAGITVPAEPALEKISPLKWSNKINVEDGEKYLDRLTEARKKPEKRKSKQTGYKVPSKQKTVNVVADAPKKAAVDGRETAERGPIENQENHVNIINNEIIETRDNDSGEVNEKANSVSSRNVQASQNDVPTPETPVAKPIKRTRKKLESRKKVKRKGKMIDPKTKKKKLHVSSSQGQSIANLLPGTLIWSASKIMPLVTPLTPNIIVSAQAQSTNPIILGNTQQNQMIVMQSLSNRVQNSVLPMRNENLMKAVQKVSLNAVPSIQTSVGMNSRDWTSGMKSIIEATKIAGRKAILPKGKEITTTTMAYKVPIPAIHRESPLSRVTEKVEQDRKKTRKTAKNKKIQKREKIDTEVKETSTKDEAISVKSKLAEKPLEDSRSEIPKNSETNEKKRKSKDDPPTLNNKQPKIIKITTLPETCKSIESLRNVIERIGEETNQSTEKPSKKQNDELSSVSNECGTNKSPEISDNTICSETSDTKNIPSCDDNANKSSPVQTENTTKDSDNGGKASSTEEPEVTKEISVAENSTPKDSPEMAKDSTNVETTETTALSEVDEAITEAGVIPDKEKDVCDLGTRFDSLLRATEKTEVKLDGNVIVESAKIILNLDTNTTTTMKPEVCPTVMETLSSETPSNILTGTIEDNNRVIDRSKEETLKSLSYSSTNTFVPIGNRTDGLHSDLSNDLFASLQVPSSSHNPESISPTAAFLMAFPLVSSLNGKTEVLEEEMKEDLKYHSQTPPMLLQIGTIEPNSFKVKQDQSSTCALTEKNSNPLERDSVKAKLTNEVTKALPKIINNETIKERLYKVVQYPETTIANVENYVATSSVAGSDVDSTIPTCEIQSSSIIDNSNVSTNVVTTNTTNSHVSSGNRENSGRKGESNSVSCSKYETMNPASTIAHTLNCGSELPKYEATTRYSTLPDYVQSYPNFATSNQPRGTYGTAKSSIANASQNTVSSLDGASLLPYSTIRSQAVQSAYVAHTTGKEPQSSQQHIYANRSKDSIVNSTESITSSSYVAFPPVTQTLQHDYPTRIKESYQNYDLHGKDGNPSFHGYPIVNSKNSTIDTNQQDRAYVTSHANNNIMSTKVTENVFQNYPAMGHSKETNDQRGNAETSGRLNSRDNQRSEPLTHGNSAKIDYFTSSNYSSFTKDSKNNHQTVDGIFNAKRNDTYVPYTRDSKKTIFDPTTTSTSQISKTQTHSTPTRYGSHQLQQQQQSCVSSASNYPQSSLVADNSVKSTTTVANNSSNFSILSWTTFSPISGNNNNINSANNGNNNIVQYESGTNHVENTEAKTVCENYAYTTIQKDASYGNILPAENFTGDSSVEKSRVKLLHENLKSQSFEDPTKTKAIVTEQKTANTSTTDDYKFVGDNKSKTNKYPMGTTYTQTEFNVLEQQHQSSKSHQTVSTKSDKTNYPVENYDSHGTFDIAEPNVTIKCNGEIYNSSNYKYNEEKEANLPVKYQPHAGANQSTILHQNNGNYGTTKNGLQQQMQSQQQTIVNKSKNLPQQQLQQQQPVRPPVNWMMTPEIKHNTNIADLILPPIGKELEFCQNNIFTQPGTYNQTATNHQFYNNYDSTVSASHGFPNIGTLPSSDTRRITDGFYGEEQPFSWSPTKNSQIEQHGQTLKSIDQQQQQQQQVIVPSTLPTLVGDLALGTNMSEKQSFLFGQMPPRSKDIPQTATIKDKELVSRDYQSMLNTQNVQQSVQGTSFLSVSQLVEHEKAEKSHQQQNHNPQNNNHHQTNANQHHQHHHHQQQQQQQVTQQQQQQPRKAPRKTNPSPRGGTKRQIEGRKQSSSNDLHLQNTDEQKLPHGFADQSYHQQQQQQIQQSKYQQNDVQWRNRHCKSNYTAEALIAGNTSVHDNNNQDKQLQVSTIKSFTTEYPQNKYPSGLSSGDMVMPTINYLSNGDDPNSYGQASVNQNFNHPSYAYSPNTNIYPTTNFITNISNTPTSYIMPLHDNPSDFIEPSTFLVPNVTTSAKTTINVSSTISSIATTSTRLTTSTSVTTNTKNHQQHYTSSVKQNCEKRNSYANGTKKSKRKSENTGMHNLEFPLTVGSPIEDYHNHPHHPHHHHHHHHAHHHGHAASFLSSHQTNPIYQNHTHTSSVGLSTNVNRVSRSGTSSNNSTLTHHHPSGTSLTNFNLSTIFPEINDKVTGYKPPNVASSGLSQSSNHPTATYPQRSNYTTNNTLGHVPQESTQFTTDLPAAPPPGVLHYKT